MNNKPFEKYSLAELRRITALLTNIIPTISLGSRYIKLRDLRLHYSPSNISSGQHTHDTSEAVLLLSGSVTYTWQVPHLLNIGGSIVFPPDCMHEWNTDDNDALRFVFWYEDDLFKNYQDTQQSPHRPELAWETRALFNDVREARPGWRFRSQARLGVILSEILALQHTVTSTSDMISQQDYSTSVDAFIRANYFKQLTLKEIADAIGNSERTLSRRFREETGVSVMHKLDVFRMEKAGELLVDTVLPLSEISKLIGIIHSGYFAIKFRHYSGMTPSQYRQFHRSGKL
jgi:AraC-like DNA-binding protein